MPQLAAPAGPAGGDPAPALAPSSAVLRLFARGCDSASLVPSSSRTVPSFRKRAAPPAAAAAEAAAPAAAAACPSAPAAAGDVSRGDSSQTSFGVSPATPTLTLRVRGGPPPAGEVRESSEHEPVSEPNVSSMAPLGSPTPGSGAASPAGRWPAGLFENKELLCCSDADTAAEGGAAPRRCCCPGVSTPSSTSRSATAALARGWRALVATT